MKGEKMENLKSEKKRVVMIGVLIIQLLAFFVPSIVALADINHPEKVNVEYDTTVNYRFRGKKSNGDSFETISTPLYAVSGSTRTPVFCIEPGVPINGPSSGGFSKNPLPSMTEKAKLISALWSQAGNNADTRMVAQAMLWQEHNKYPISEIVDLSSNRTIDLSGIKTRINQTITDYQKKPSFDQSTTTVTLGKSVTLTDQNSSNLSSFDRVVKNTANVDYKINGNQLIITPKTDSKESGELVFEKSVQAGTPIAYKKAGEQTVMAGAIDQTNRYTVKINVEKYGKLKIVKRDKESNALVPNTIFTLDFGGVIANQEVKTGEDGSVTLDKIPHGTNVTIKEKSVPVPYVIDETPMKATVKAGETIELTSKNSRAKGQIILDKIGAETGIDLWNQHYSLAGNEFEIRKDAINGPIVKTIVTDDKGHAETPKLHDQALELGTYFVVESKASNGFVNTFSPAKVELKYANQTVSLITGSAKGTNKEITGESLLTKFDKETEKETQGSAVFEKAEYTLFYGEDTAGHKKGDPVKWTDKFKPKMMKGTQSKTPNTKDSITLVIDQERQVGVSHLAMGKYYWRETKAPIGYTEDQTNYEFEIKKKGDQLSNAVVKESTTAKEQVIRMNLDFFKFANSEKGSASAGVNDLEFKLTPLEGTKEITGTKDTAVTQYNDQLGFDGYGKFENVPIGDYLLEEVEAPKGFQKIKPLEIHSRFEENEEDYKQSQYVFTITELDQKESLKTVKVPYVKLTNQAFTVNLNRLMLYDLPEEKDTITSLATWINEEKILEDQTNNTAIDNVNYKLSKTKDDWFLVSQVVDVAATKKAQEKEKNAEPIIVAEKLSTQKNDSKEGTWQVEQIMELEKIAEKSLVLFNTLYENEEAYKDGKEPVAFDNNLDNQAQTLKVDIPKNSVTIKTKAHLEKDGNTFTHGDVLAMYDDVETTHTEVTEEKESFETILVAILPDGTSKEIWKSDKEEYIVDDEAFTKTIVTEKVDTGKYPKGTLFTFKEVHYDKDGEINGKHNEDLTEKDQTIYPKDAPQPEEKTEVPKTSEPVETPESKEFPSEPNMPSAESSEKSYPQTGEKNDTILLFIGLLLLVFSCAVYLLKRQTK